MRNQLPNPKNEGLFVSAGYEIDDLRMQLADLRARLAAAEQKASEGEKDKARLESARFWLSSVLAKENCNTTILDVLDELKEACESQEWFREEIDRVCDAAMRKGE